MLVEDGLVTDLLQRDAFTVIGAGPNIRATAAASA